MNRNICSSIKIHWKALELLFRVVFLRGSLACLPVPISNARKLKQDFACYGSCTSSTSRVFVHGWLRTVTLLPSSNMNLYLAANRKRLAMLRNCCDVTTNRRSPLNPKPYNLNPKTLKP